jgi:hypothetical protein
MTKQFETDEIEASNYADDGLNDSIMKAHIAGQRHAASVLLAQLTPEIERLEKALDLAVSFLEKESYAAEKMAKEIEKIRGEK